MSEPRSTFWSRQSPGAVPPGIAPAARVTRPRSSTTSDAADTPTAFWALVAFTAVLLVAPQTYWAPLNAIPIAKVTALAAVLTHVLTSLSRGRPVVRWAPETRLAAMLLGWSAATIPFAEWPGGAFGVLQEQYLKSLIIFWILGEVVASIARLRQLLWSLVLLSTPLSLTATMRFRSGEFLEGASGVTRILGYEAPLTTNPNDLALMLNLVIPIALGLLMTTERASRRLLLVGVVFVSILGVLMTFSRGGFLTLAAVGSVYVFRTLRRPQRHWALAAVVVGIICLTLMPASYWTRLATIFNPEQDVTGSSQARKTQIYAAILHTIQHPFIGAGVGLNALALADEGGGWHIVHNVWLQYSVDLGLPGLILFAMLFFSSLRTTRAARRASSRQPASSGLSSLAEGVELSLIAFGVATLFHPVAYNFYFYYFGGLAVAVGRIARASVTAPASETVKPSRPLPRFRPRLP